MTDAVLRALDLRARQGNPARLWLRDDDAVAPSVDLDRLLGLTEGAGVPVTLAVIPAHAGQALADRLAGAAGVTVAVHGWAHINHAGIGEKAQELGAHRAVETVLAELSCGFAQLHQAHGAQFCPVLVPPWNRIAPQVVAGLPGVGFRALSTFGPEREAPLPLINTHVDVMDWRGGRVGKPDAVLMDEIGQAMARGNAPVGLLTHHLAHDAQAWGFLQRLFATTAGHQGCVWVGLPALITSP